MLSLNSYGLPRSNNAADRGVTLPRLNVGSPQPRVGVLSPFSPVPPQGVRSLSKFEMMRRPEHPLYRTTTGYEYGRHLEIPDSARSVPKHGRQADFTHEFIAGPFHDSSLTSIDKSKLRAESWQHKVEERTKLMKIKYEELQQKLEVKKVVRRKEREIRRREQAQRVDAAIAIQARVRGFVVRSQLQKTRHILETEAASRIQQVFRSHEQVKRAKEELESKRRQRLNVVAAKIQRACQQFVLRRRAVRAMDIKRRERMASLRLSNERDGFSRRTQLTHDEAAYVIQKVMRQQIGRRVQRSHSIRSNSSAVSGSDGKDGGEGSQSGANSARLKQTQRLARRTIVSMKQRKREKSSHRLV